MNAGIYLVKGDDELIRMDEHPYDSEDLLQELLEKYPNILAGDQMDSARPRRWLLVKREAELASEEDGANRWSVDHLFLDQDGIPTIVEVKRSSDTRIRREVVGQMLDYAANGVVYWPIEKIRAMFESHCELAGKNHEQVLTEFLAGDGDAETFWSQVKTNFEAGRIRLLFVADEIPNELRRIVEFLNEQMKSAEVLAIEIKQFTGQGLKTLVPRVIGQTAEAERAKSAGGNRGEQWTEVKFFSELEKNSGASVAQVAKQILEWSKPRFQSFYWGRGAKAGSFAPFFVQGDLDYPSFAVWTYGTVEIYFQHLKSRPVFSSDNKRLELLRKLNLIPGVSIPESTLSKRPGISLELLKDKKSLGLFFDAFDWLIQEIKNEPKPDSRF
jgi:hypothetical protein